MIKQNLKNALILVMSLIVTACSPVKDKINDADFSPLPLEEAVKLSSQHIMDAVNAERSFREMFKDSNILVAPFLDLQTLQEMHVTEQITKLFTTTLTKNKHVTIKPLSINHLGTAHYIIQGYISKQVHKPSQQRIFRLESVTRSIKTGKILTRTNAWIKADGIQWKTTVEYNDRPFFVEINNRHNKKRIQHLTNDKTPTQVLKEASLAAILDSAGRAYNAKQYDKALGLYRHAVAISPEATLRTYAGLYLSHVRLDNIPEAEKAFEKVVQLNLSSSNKLNMKILFAVSSTDFSGTDTMKQQFLLWVKIITQYFSDNKECFSVAGHSSRSGSESFNQRLSLKRAQSIKDRSTPYYSGDPSMINTSGKGFSENIIGTGADDMTDAIDRRVEFSKGC